MKAPIFNYINSRNHEVGISHNPFSEQSKKIGISPTPKVYVCVLVLFLKFALAGCLCPLPGASAVFLHPEAENIRKQWVVL